MILWQETFSFDSVKLYWKETSISTGLLHMEKSGQNAAYSSASWGLD